MVSSSSPKRKTLPKKASKTPTELTLFSTKDRELLDRLVNSKKAVVSGAKQLKKYIDDKTAAEKAAVDEALQKYHVKVEEVRSSEKFKSAEKKYNNLYQGFNKDVEEAAVRFSELVDSVRQSKDLSEEEKEEQIGGMYNQAMDIIYPGHKEAFQRHLLLIL